MTTKIRANRKRANATLALLLVSAFFSTACEQSGVLDFPGAGSIKPALSASSAPTTTNGIDVTYQTSFDGDVSLEILSEGRVVARRSSASARIDLPADSYVVRIVEEGAVTRTADGAHSGALAVISDSFDHDGLRSTVDCDASGCAIR